MQRPKPGGGGALIALSRVGVGRQAPGSARNCAVANRLTCRRPDQSLEVFVSVHPSAWAMEGQQVSDGGGGGAIGDGRCGAAKWAVRLMRGRWLAVSGSTIDGRLFNRLGDGTGSLPYI